MAKARIDWKNLDISKLTEKTISRYLKAAQSSVSKQMQRWEKREFKSPAYYALDKSGGKISTKGKNTLQEKKKELARARRFLTDKTRTISGWEEVKKANTKRLNDKLARFSDNQLTTDEYDRYFTAFEKAKELNPNITSMSYKYNVMDALVEALEDNAKSADELAIEMSEAFREIYETHEALERAAEDSDNISGLLNYE